MAIPLDCPHAAECKQKGCGIWDPKAGCCGYLSGPEKISNAIHGLASALLALAEKAGSKGKH